MWQNQGHYCKWKTLFTKKFIYVCDIIQAKRSQLIENRRVGCILTAPIKFSGPPPYFPPKLNIQFISNFHSLSVSKIFLFLILSYNIFSPNPFQFPVFFFSLRSVQIALSFPIRVSLLPVIYLVIYFFIGFYWIGVEDDELMSLEGGGNLVKKNKKMRLFPLSSSSSSSMDNEQRDGVQKTRSLMYLNVYDLTPVNNYLYWFGLGVFHSGVEGNWLPHCTTFVLDSWILKLIISH